MERYKDTFILSKNSLYNQVLVGNKEFSKSIVRKGIYGNRKENRIAEAEKKAEKWKMKQEVMRAEKAKSEEILEAKKAEGEKRGGLYAVRY